MWEQLPAIAEGAVKYGTVIIYIIICISGKTMDGDTTGFLHNSDTLLQISHAALTASGGGILVGLITQSNIAWFVGIIAAFCSIYASLLSAKEKRMSIEKMNRDKHIKRKP